MRGTHLHRERFCLRRRIIPAHAGNSWNVPSTLVPSSDHPRACGELGMYPSRRVSLSGSSPRMRGTLRDNRFRRRGYRIIPAHAGNSRSSSRRARCMTDHPRACGELTLINATSGLLNGSSPRMRGTPVTLEFVSETRRIIPAHAGNSRSSASSRSFSSDHPRACGELHSPRLNSTSPSGSSPRMRGTPPNG